MTAWQPATPLQRGLAILLRRYREQNLLAYLNILYGKGYLKGGDAIKMMNAPSASFTATVTTTNGVDQLSDPIGTAALKV